MKSAARTRPADRNAALKVQSALLIELLLMVQARIGNLGGLRLDRHIIRRKGMVHLAIPGEEVKNGSDIEAVLPTETARLLLLYLDRYRSVLLDGPSEFLFPGRGGKAKTLVTLQYQIGRRVKRHCGLVVNPHLFRHLVADLVLTARPGDYGTVRLLHGHKSAETTTRFYCGCGTETAAAFEQLDRLIQSLRGERDSSPGEPERRE